MTRRTLVRYCQSLALAFAISATLTTALADNVEVYYTNYLQSSQANKISAANRFFTELEEYADTLYAFSPSADKWEVETQVNYWMADYYYNKALYDLSIEAGEKAMIASSHIKDKQQQSDVFSVLGIAHYRKGYFEVALQYFRKGYDIDKQLDNDENMSSDLNNLSSVYLALRQPDAAAVYIERAIELERKLDQPERMAIRLGMASEIYLAKKDYDKALALATEAYKLDSSQGRPLKAAIRQSQMAAVYIEMGKLDEAQNAITRAIAQIEHDGAKSSLAICYRLQGRIFVEQRQWNQAAQFYNRALALGKEMGNTFEERENERGLWLAMRNVAPQAALAHLERYSAIADSMFKAESARQLSMFRAKYRTDELVRQNKQFETRNRTIILIAAILLLFLLAAIVAAVFAMRQKAKATRLAKEVDTLRTHFVTNITNEFRNPLSVILGIGNQLKASDNADEQNKGDTIVRQGDTLLGLVNQLLDAAHISASVEEPDWRKGDIAAYVHMIVDNYHDKAIDKGLSISFASSESSIMTDFVPSYVSKMMHHLLTNAFNFTPRTGNVNVTVSTPDATHVAIAVSDNGIGIAPSEIQHIFEPNFRGSNVKDVPGFGLGLSLVKNMVNTMNGYIDVNSAPGNGTTLTITLPIEQTAVATQPLVTAPQPPAGQPSAKLPAAAQKPEVDALPIVLIVESHVDMAYYIGNLLHQHYKVFYARNGVEGFDKVQDLVPSLVIAAQQMPEMNGFELCSKIRATESVSHVPLLMITSTNTNELRIKGIEAGADAYLAKPFSDSELLTLVDNLLKQRQALREKFSSSTEQLEANEQKTASKADQEFLNKLVNLIHAQMSKGEIDTDTIATAMGMSRKQLRTKVQTITGEPTANYVLRVRMGKAKRLVRTTSASIGEVAAKCGFQDVAHFSRAFKQFFGVTPSQYRKNVD